MFGDKKTGDILKDVESTKDLAGVFAKMLGALLKGNIVTLKKIFLFMFIVLMVFV